ncbi:hypothetical protein EC991_007880 [Linnemannia zychae]|nr:hypothetical protein EC991_007880 [Linnemannia zychae]
MAGLAQSNVDSSEGNNGSGEQGRGGGTFQSMKKRLSLRLTGGGTPSSGVVGSEVIERRLSQGNNIHHKDPVVRQYTKDSSKTLTSESTTALLVREDLKDDSSLLHKGGAGVGFGSVGGGGFGNRNNLQQNRLTLATINFQDSDYAGETRRGSTATAFSNLTQTTYGLNVNTPHSGYYSEKVGYDNNGKSSPGLNNRHSYNLSTLSPTTPNTPRESIFGMAGSNNNNQAPNGKKYIDTRKLKKQQKGDKKLAKASFSKAKSLFSNERTFLHWIKFGMLLGALAMTLLNFSGDEVARKGVDVALANKVGLIGRNVGVTLLLVCLLTLIYSATTYHWRHLGIVKDKSSTRYFDRVGPTVFTLALFMTYTINVVLTIQVTSLMDHGYEPSIYLNNVDSNSPAPQPSFPPPSISPAMPTSTLAPLPLSPPVTPALPPPQPQKPVFDAPYLPPGSTILIDGEDEDGNEYESSHSSDSGDTEDPTVNTASTSDDSSSSRSSSEETSSPESDSSNSESDHSTANSSRGGNDGNRQEEEDDDN